MTDRVSKIIIRGDVSDLQAKMVAAGKSVKDFGDRLTDQDKRSQKFRQGLTSVGDAAGKMGLVAAAGLGVIVATTAKFDKQMSAVQAATHESADSMEALRQAAVKAGADTVFSASEAAQGIENLAKAGVATTDILGGGLQGALDLAAAGSIDVGQAAETAATAMSQFSLSGKDVPHIADLLAAAAGKAQGEVSDFAQALNQVGLVANQTGLSIEETTGGLAAFAHAGLLGSDAGTSFKTMLLALVPKSEEAGKLMDTLGFSAFDAQGNFVGLAETAGRLRDALKGYSAEARQSYLQTIFGTDAIRSANVLYEQGAAGIDKWIGKVNDQGYAAETAATKLDNLSGDLEAFKGSLETALIGSGEGSQGFLRGLVQGATDVVNAFNKMPSAAQGVATSLLGITAVTGGGLFLGARFVNQVADARAVLGNLGISADSTKGRLKSLGRDGFNLVADQARSAGEAFQEMSGKQVALRGGAAVIGGLALSLNHLDDSTNRATQSMGAFVNVGSGALLGFAAGGPIGAAIGGGVTAITTLVGALNDGDKASRAAADGAKAYASTLDDVTGAATEATRAMVAQRLEQDGILTAASKLGIRTEDLVSGILNEGDARRTLANDLKELRAQYTGAAEGQDVLTTALAGGQVDLNARIKSVSDANAKYGDLLPVLDSVNSAFGTEASAIDSSVDSTKRKATAVGDVTTATGGLTDATGADTDATEKNTQAIKDNVDAMQKRYDANVAAFDAETAYQQALDEGTKRQEEAASIRRQINDAKSKGASERADLQSQLAGTKDPKQRAALQDRINQSLKDQAKQVAELQARLGEYAKTLDASTEAGRANRDILSDMAKAWNNLSDKQKNAKGAYADARQALIRQAEQFGATRREAARYADRLLQIPPKVTTQITLDKQRAEEQLAAIKAQYDAIRPKTVKITFKAFRDASIADANRALNAPPPGSTPTRKADGGYISGPGTGTSDSIPAYLSNGEFVIRAAAVERYGVGFMHELNRMRFAQGGYVDQRAQRTQSRQGFASGGYVSGGLSGGDLDRIVTALSAIRPLYGHQTVMPHNYSEFRRQQDADQRAAEMGAVTFRA